MANLAKIRCHAQQIFLRELLIAHNKNQMIVPNLIDEIYARLIEGLAQINAMNFSANMLRQRRNAILNL